jgi:hypothetical protein
MRATRPSLRIDKANALDSAAHSIQGTSKNCFGEMKSVQGESCKIKLA